MGFDQYHEPPGELSAEVRSRARILASLTEEVEAINWYEQRLAVETDAEARAIMANAQAEEFKHFAMDLEYLMRRMPLWREISRGVLFTDGDIVAAGDTAEGAAGVHGGDGGESAGPADSTGTLGIGGLKDVEP